MPALHEHRRVLKDDGLLLLTVPRVNSLKQWNDWRALMLSRAKWYRSPRGRIVSRVRETTVTEDHGLSFIQYEFPTRVVKGFLSAAGFETVSVWPMYVNAGIGESTLVRRVSERRHGTVAGGRASDAEDAVRSAGHERSLEVARRTEHFRRGRWKLSKMERLSGKQF
jgi:hypothetical protein